MDLYDRLAKNWTDRVERKEQDTQVPGKGKKPLKMPKDYNFSTRNVNWNDYKNDFILRTDAVWEKSKLKDTFYAIYRQFAYDQKTNKYYLGDLRVVPNPTTIADHLLDWEEFQGYTPVPGCIFQVKSGPKIFGTPGFSHFVCDKEGDAWYSCFISFQKFMKCNERSEVPLEEASLHNGGFFEYP